MLVPSSSANMERLKDRNVVLCGIFVVGCTCQDRCYKKAFVVIVKPNYNKQLKKIKRQNLRKILRKS